MMSLEMREPHLDALSLVSRSGERFCLHLPPCDIASVLVEVARDLARVSRGAALRSDRAHIAVVLRGAVEQRSPVVHCAAGPEQLAVGADVGPALPVPAEGLQLLMHIGEHRRHEYIDAPEQVALRDTIVEPKLIE